MLLLLVLQSLLLVAIVVVVVVVVVVGWCWCLRWYCRRRNKRTLGPLGADGVRYCIDLLVYSSLLTLAIL